MGLIGRKILQPSLLAWLRDWLLDRKPGISDKISRFCFINTMQISSWIVFKCRLSSELGALKWRQRIIKVLLKETLLQWNGHGRWTRWMCKDHVKCQFSALNIFLSHCWPYTRTHQLRWDRDGDTWSNPITQFSVEPFCILFEDKCVTFLLIPLHNTQAAAAHLVDDGQIPGVGEEPGHAGHAWAGNGITVLYCTVLYCTRLMSG